MRTANLAGLRLASAVLGVLLAAVAIALVSLAVGVSVSDDFHVANLSLLRSAAELSMPQLLYWGAFTLVQIFATAACVAALSVSFALCPRATIAGIAPLALFMTFLLVMTLYSDVKVPALAAEHLLLGMLSVILIGATVVLIPVVLRQGILTRREAAWSLVAWAAYGSVYFLPLDYRSLLDPAVSPALVATWLFAGSLFPLAGMMMSTWSLHLIRHR
jgi:hypothetical protein